MPSRSRTGAHGPARTIVVNRAPVLTLWAAVVAERLGYDRDEAATLGRAVAGLNAASKAIALGIAQPKGKPVGGRGSKKAKPGERLEVPMCNRMVPAVQTPGGLRATHDGKPTEPASVHRYLESKFGDGLEAARAAMAELAAALPRAQLAAEAFALYESFRPRIPAGTRGWGAKGALDLETIRALAQRSSRE